MSFLVLFLCLFFAWKRDERRLQINSAKYCPGCQIQIMLGENSLCFEDNGQGIPSHELHRVTERGFSGTAGEYRDKAPAWGST